jgi:hypothetical protein
MDTIGHYAGFPATGVSLQQMVQFGEKPSTGEDASLLAEVVVLIVTTRDPFPRISIPFRRASDTACPPGTRTRNPARWFERHVLD